VAAAPADIDESYELSHRYTRERGRVYLTGVQALVRLPLLQKQRDRAAGLDTAGFISGYRGSPLGTYDTALWQARDLLEAHDVLFSPGVNEDLAATAVWGSQQAGLMPGARRDGVFGIWYGKGPGVDRSLDALKHANYAGTSPHGGVLALTGDDPGAKSSSIAHQSEHALVHCGMPILNPASVQEYLDLGLLGLAMSRFAGSWVAMKCLTDTVDSAASVEVGPERVRIVAPRDFTPPPGGLHIAWANYPLSVEQRLYQQRLPAVHAFARANGLDRVTFGAGGARRLGIVTTGKAYLDVRQALEDLGLDEARARELGLEVFKVALSWPLEPEAVTRFALGLEDLLVVEEKRPLVEDQLARLLYNQPERPRLLGKHDEHGTPLVPAEGELAPGLVAEVLRGWLARRAPEAASRLAPPPAPVAPPAGGTLMRLPAFCSGCPHNTSTLVPQDSLALGGIGCHGMAVWLPGRNTLAVTQMGGEGANWIGIAPFSETKHVFQNLGDGTYFHSGLLAIRAAVTAGVNITFKVLANGAVAMTGGQPIEGEALEGEITVPQIVAQLRAEGVGRVEVVTNEPDKYAPGTLPKDVSVHHRDALDHVQRSLREVPGTTALVYDQTCAAEARRLRKRDAFPDPDRRIVINEAVCEGCGDCSVQSNCISIEPVETPLGRKRRIDQSSCNKDYSCVKGYCPSFVSVSGVRPRKVAGEAVEAGDRFADLPLPERPPLDRPWNVLVTGIGGGGVVTVGAIVAVAAHLERLGCSELDVTGLAQKNGPVSSHVRIARDSADLHATRIPAGAADLVIGSDIVVTTGVDGLSRMGRGRTTAVVNTHVAPTSEFASNPDLDLSSREMERAIAAAAGEEGCHFVPATQLATALLGDAIATNLFLLGYAFQLGRLPVSLRALERAVDLNGRAVEMNLRAFSWGRLAAHDRAAVDEAARPALRAGAEPIPESLAEIVAHRAGHLARYQNPRLARRYRALVDRVAVREQAVRPGSDVLARAVAKAYAKILAYKDEYEVARLYSDGHFVEQLSREFEGEPRVTLHFNPQHLPILDRFLARRDPNTGRMPKWNIPARGFLPVLRVMAKFKFLRATPFDPFRNEHRRLEQALIPEYEERVEEVLATLSTANHDLAVELASLPEHVRGFGLVKEAQLADVRVKETELLHAYRSAG
jgi:indolepyruvate ferredoxin oxidoreductase